MTETAAMLVRVGWAGFSGQSSKEDGLIMINQRD